MKHSKLICTLLSLTAFVSLSGCSSESATGGEIKIPIYNTEVSYKTQEVKRMDLVQSETSGASIGYVFAENQYSPVSANLVSIEATLFQNVKKGDVIARFDSSALDYEYLEKEIKLSAAKDAYNASPTESNKLAYELAKAEFDEVEYKVSCYTLTAPYDGVITSIARPDEGSEISKGTFIYSIGKPDEIYVYFYGDDSKFQLGQTIQVKFTGEYHPATVLSVPSKSGSDSQQQWWGGGNDRNKDVSASPNSISTSSNVVVGFTAEELAKIIEETPNAVTAGWATINYVSAQANGVVAVPSKAVKLFSGSYYVYQYENGQKLQTPVEVGQTINGYSIILSGLHEGDEIIVD